METPTFFLIFHLKNFFLKNAQKNVVFLQQIFHNVKFVLEDIEDTVFYSFFNFFNKIKRYTPG